MSDPLSAALAVYKGATALDKAKKLVDRFASRNTEQFIAQRDEMFREWTSEMAALLGEHVSASAEAFLLIGGAIEDHQGKLEEILDTPEIEVLAVLYSEAAYREALDERRNMLKHAAAAIIDLAVSIAEKCRAEKVLRDLDPNDVLELDRMDRVAGTVERVADGKGRHHYDEDRHRYVRLLDSPSSDALLSSESMRVMGGKIGGDTAVITTRGRIILHLLRSYILPRRRPASGREAVPGQRERDTAIDVLGAEFRNRVMMAATLARAGPKVFSKPPYLRHYRVQFDFPRPQLDAKNRDFQPIVEPRPDERSRLHLSPCPVATSQAVVEAAPKGLHVTCGGNAQDGFIVQIDGPFDVLRWVADDVDAWWA
jgi:hypothetical protein